MRRTMPGSVLVSRFLPSYGALIFFVISESVDAALGAGDRNAALTSGRAAASLRGIIADTLSAGV